MRSAYALHMRQQNLVLFPFLYIELMEFLIEVIFHYNDKNANRDLKLKYISIRKAKADEEKVKIHTQVQRLDFRDSAKVKRLRQLELEQRWSKTHKRHLEERLQASR